MAAVAAIPSTSLVDASNRDRHHYSRQAT